LIRLGWFAQTAMSQIIEFVGNHTLLFVAFFMTLGMLVYTEYTRMAGAGAALSPYDATQKMNEGNAVFLDVRDESEYKGGHLLNSLSMPVSKLAERMHEVDKFKDKEIVVYCDNGMRASRAMGKLKKNGCTQLFSLAGGLAAWEKANLPTVSK
jgi:rhodanese-related sulfurtransferase